MITLTTTNHIIKIINNELERVGNLYDDDMSKYKHMLTYYKALYDAKNINRDSYMNLINGLDEYYGSKDV